MIDVPALRAALDSLYDAANFRGLAQRDPVRIPRRYSDPEDAEIAALLASGFAYGRVDLFLPVLEQLFVLLDSRGGPAAAVRGLDPARDGAALLGLQYRWTRGADVLLLLGALQGLQRRGGRLQVLVEGNWRGDLGACLDHTVGELRALALDAARSWGQPARDFEGLPHGLKNFLPLPADGSACKRWNMLMRWMVRPPKEGVDLGLWTGIPSAALVMPLDVHTLRFGQWLGLTARKDGSWRTAVELTDGLRRLDPLDPVRYDFALAHLGISGSCPGGKLEQACAVCPLMRCCGAPPLQSPARGARFKN